MTGFSLESSGMEFSLGFSVTSSSLESSGIMSSLGPLLIETSIGYSAIESSLGYSVVGSPLVSLLYITFSKRGSRLATSLTCVNNLNKTDSEKHTVCMKK